MKKIKLLNAVFLVSLFLTISVSIWLYFQLSREIGNISFQKEHSDSPHFRLCPDNKIYQYYSVNTSFVGGRNAIREEIYKFLKVLDDKDHSFSGYVTTRFIVNCNGEIDRIRIKSVNSHFQDYSINAASSNLIIQAIRRLKNFIPGQSSNGQSVNSYFQLNFKIEAGEIIDIF
ncbi:energy transducer TonB [Moheibacter lacus]|uniref:TonB protein C-terminal n=1 Tax=Moheibacter lacus TaxID=2745851 RepID=A0A838ZJ02_9FLAO|nr:hypothetical protein [Moheibacter lacus]MBA5629238.1 hypothetical protein [Moheibacter lacus]